MVRQAGDQASLDQRAFPTTRRSVDETHRKRLFGVRFLDLGFPKAKAVGQSLSVTRAGQKFQEKVRIVFIKGSQSFGHNLDGLAVGSRSRSRSGRSAGET